MERLDVKGSPPTSTVSKTKERNIDGKDQRSRLAERKQSRKHQRRSRFAPTHYKLKTGRWQQKAQRMSVLHVETIMNATSTDEADKDRQKRRDQSRQLNSSKHRINKNEHKTAKGERLTKCSRQEKQGRLASSILRSIF